jgi:hypothetical protein
VQVVPASAEQSRAMTSSARELEPYARGQATLAVLRRYAYWQSLVSSAQPYGGVALLAKLVGGDLVNANDNADFAASQFASVLRGLDDGSLELVGWVESASSTDVTLAVTKAGLIARPLGFWPLVPVLVVGALVVGAGVYLANAWVAMRAVEANADALRAQTQAKVTAAVAGVAAQDPQAAAALADALERANNAAAGVQPGLLDQLAKGLANVTAPLRDAGSSGLLVLAALWYFATRKGGKA